MAEEQVVESTVEPSQAEQASDYFSMYSEEVGNDGGPVGKTPEGAKAEESKPEPQPKAEPKAEETSTKLKPADQKEEAKPQTGLKPDGLYGTWFAEGEDGEKVLDTDKALGFLTPDNGRFVYPGRQFAEPKPADQQPSGEPKDEFTEKWEKYNSFNEGLENNMFMYKTELLKALQSGMNADQAFAAADNAVKGVLSKELSKRRMEWDREMYTSGRTKEEATAKQEQLRGMARTNEQKMITEHFNGDAKLYSQTIAQVGGAFVNQLFDVMNPDAVGKLTQAEHGKAIQEWWTNKIASDPNTYGMVMTAIRGQAALEALPDLLKQARKQAQSQTAEAGEGHRRSPSGIERSSQGTSATGFDSLDQFLHVGDNARVEV